MISLGTQLFAFTCPQCGNTFRIWLCAKAANIPVQCFNPACRHRLDVTQASDSLRITTHKPLNYQLY